MAPDQPDFVKGATGPAQVYDTSAAGLGLNPAYLGASSASASSTSTAQVSGVTWASLDSNGTFTYDSADSPTFVMNTPVDLTAVVSVGQRIQLTQTTVKFFIVTAISSTKITMYGGTDYTLANAAISLVSYSAAKAPLGFPVDPAKWTQTLTDTTQRTQSTPTSATYYNLGSLSLSVPIGCWFLEYDVSYYAVSTGTVDQSMTLSTANNTQSDTSMTCYAVATIPALGSNAEVQGTFHRRRTLTVAAKTSYYLNSATGQTGVASIGNQGAASPTLIRAICAYL